MRGIAFRRSTVVLACLATALAWPRPASAQHRAALKRRGENVFASLPFDPAAGGLALSPGATRSAYVRPKDAGFCVVVDGAEGPVFSRIGRAGVAFSGDGQHWAHAAEKDGKWHVVFDGAQGEAFDAVRDDSITFSAEGGRVAFVAERGDKSLVVADGQPGAAYDRVVEGSVVFSPAGAALAYVAADAAGEFVVYQGVRGSAHARVGRPRFSRDGSRLAYAASAGDESFVVVDGVASPARPGAAAVRPLSLAFSPDGRRLAYVAVTPDGRERVVLDGADGKAYDRVFDDSLTFAADSARLAHVARLGKQAVVVVDGAEVGKHAGVAPGTVRFSPDGRRVAYVAETAGADGAVRRHPAVDGIEGKGYDWIGDAPTFSPVGRHVAFVAQRRRADGGGFESVLVVDGAESSGAFPWIRGDVAFTADGRRVAYLAAAADVRFAEAALVPRQPGDPSAGARLVFHRPPANGRRVVEPGGAVAGAEPVKLLTVEEDLEVD